MEKKPVTGSVFKSDSLRNLGGGRKGPGPCFYKVGTATVGI